MVFGGSIRNLRSVLQSVLFVPFAYAVFFNMIPTFLVAWDNATRLQERFSENFRFSRNNSYDFIVVGGGSAGSVVASRLSEFYSVLLIEAGGPPNPLHLIPALTLSMANHPQTDWRYRTLPQSRACLNSINQECLISGGRSTGGSSNLDNMAFIRGHPLDFDNWARILGDNSWSYQQLIPFFRRSEEFIGTSTDGAARGTNGELRVREPDFIGLGSLWLRGGQEMGFSNMDLNGQHTQGFSILQYPIRRGMRQSTDNAFIRPIRLNSRLRVLSHATATRILFRDMTNMAYGVEYERFGRTELAIATREVIVSSGTLGSPKLLLLSGIGPRSHLEQMGIPLRSDVPVGRNLQDHLGVPLGPFFINTTNSFIQDRDITPENIVNWIIKGRGPLSTTGMQGAAVISSTPARARGEQNRPDILLLLQGQGAHRNWAQQFARANGLQVDEMMRFYQNALGRDAFHIWVVGARPTSTGQLLLMTPNPRDAVMINPQFLEDSGQADIRILTEGLMTALRLVENTTTFQNIGARLSPVLLPGCDTLEARTMAYWDCYIRRFSMSQHNPVGTVSMGTVLDSNLKVRGTRGLRVVDASVMPSIVSVGTLATTIMIAEKASDSILREHSGNGTPIPAIPRGIGGTLTAAVFGRNGIINRNPLQRFLSQEFDRLNPLPSLFRIPPNRTDFNPFSRFLGFFQQNNNGNGGAMRGGVFENIFGALNQQTNTLFGTLLSSLGIGGGNPNLSNPNRSNFPIGNLLQLVFPQSTRSQLSGNNNLPLVRNNNNASNLFDIIFPVRNNTITLPNPFQNIFGNQNRNTQQRQPPQTQNLLAQLLQPQRNSNSNNRNGSSRPLLLNPLQGLLLPQQNNAGTRRPNILGAFFPTTVPSRNQNQQRNNINLLNPLTVLFGTTSRPQTREPFFTIALPTIPSRLLTSSIPLAEGSSPVPALTSPSLTSTSSSVNTIALNGFVEPPPEQPSTNSPPSSTTLELPSPSLSPTTTTQAPTIVPLPAPMDPPELPLIEIESLSSNNDSVSFAFPILEDIVQSSTPAPETTEEVPLLSPTTDNNELLNTDPGPTTPPTTADEEPISSVTLPTSSTIPTLEETTTSPFPEGLSINEVDGSGNDIFDTESVDPQTQIDSPSLNPPDENANLNSTNGEGGNDPGSIRAIRLVNEEAEKFRKVHKELHPFPVLIKPIKNAVVERDPFYSDYGADSINPPILNDFDYESENSPTTLRQY